MKNRPDSLQLSLLALFESSDGGAAAQDDGAPVVEAQAATKIPPAKLALAQKAPLILMEASDSRGMSPSILARVVPSRLELLSERPDAEEATDFEAMLYLSSASLTAPLPHSYAEILFYLCARLLPQGREVIADAPYTLGVSESYDLTALKSWIYRQQVKHCEGLARGDKRAGGKRGKRAGGETAILPA